MKDSIKKLLTLMASVPNDKLLHFFYGTIAAIPFVIWGTTMEAIGAMVAISIGKEILDSTFKFSTPNALDALFTFAPVVILLAVKLL